MCPSLSGSGDLFSVYAKITKELYHHKAKKSRGGYQYPEVFSSQPPLLRTKIQLQFFMVLLELKVGFLVT